MHVCEGGSLGDYCEANKVSFAYVQKKCHYYISCNRPSSTQGTLIFLRLLFSWSSFHHWPSFVKLETQEEHNIFENADG